MKIKKRRLTPKEFAYIHTLLDLKIAVGIVAKIVGKSDAVIYAVRNYTNMEEYLAACKKRVNDSKERRKHLLGNYSGALQPTTSPEPKTERTPEQVRSEIHEIYEMVKKLVALMTP